LRGDRFVNNNGNVMTNSGINYYCGKPFGYKVRKTDGHCGPNNGPQCKSCKKACVTLKIYQELCQNFPLSVTLPELKEEEIKEETKEEIKTPVKVQYPQKDCVVCGHIMTEPCKLPCKHYCCIQCVPELEYKKKGETNLNFTKEGQTNYGWSNVKGCNCYDTKTDWGKGALNLIDSQYKGFL